MNSAVISRYEGKLALLRTWEERPPSERVLNHYYLTDLKKRVQLLREEIEADGNA